MARIVTIFWLLGSINLLCPGQDNVTNVDEVIWFGLDYTHVKFIGSSDQFSDLEAIQHTYFRSWNELIVTESSKYDLKLAFNVRKVEYELDSAIARSERRDMDNILQMEDYELSKDQVVNIAKTYADPGTDKVGALFVMETLNKIASVETMWVAFFHVSTGEVFFVEKLNGKPSGFGFRNYWAGGYYRALRKGISRY